MWIKGHSLLLALINENVFSNEHICNFHLKTQYDAFKVLICKLKLQFCNAGLKTIIRYLHPTFMI